MERPGMSTTAKTQPRPLIPRNPYRHPHSFPCPRSTTLTNHSGRASANRYDNRYEPMSPGKLAMRFALPRSRTARSTAAVECPKPE
jgi:hypothetical protein